MTVQLALLGDPVTITPDGTPLTPRQQHVLDYIAASPDGRDAAEIGAMLHELRGTHRPGYERCRWCAEEGLGVLRSARLRALLIRRRTGMWQLRDKRHVEEGGQLSELPGDTFEDLFRGAA